MRSATKRFLLLAALAAVAVLLSFRSPHEPGSYPPCPSRVLTGFHCPGCGTLRALHALVHGDIAQALAYNTLAVLVLPLVITGLFRGMVHDVRGQPPRPLPGWTLRALLIVIMAYWVLRNVPGPPFDQLAPHELSG